jgi:hypothetical protein
MLVLTRIQKAKRARRRDKVCRFASCDIGWRPGNRRGVLSQRSRITAPLLALTMLKVAEEFPRPINVANVITRSNGQPASAGDADLENTRSRGGTIADAQSRAQRSTDDGFARDGSAGGSRLLSAGGSGLRLSGRRDRALCGGAGANLYRSRAVLAPAERAGTRGVSLCGPRFYGVSIWRVRCRRLSAGLL